MVLMITEIVTRISLNRSFTGTWDLVLLAKGGWGAEKQLDVYSEVSNRRDNREGVIIWQYYLNDIEDSGKVEGLAGPIYTFFRSAASAATRR
tara:strand:+ start:673 stop:948 length:276 start_codon:yes stop_codon:yes gene_type:complete